MGGVNDMCDIQDFIDDLKTDANDTRQKIAKQEPSQRAQEIAGLVDYYDNLIDAPMLVDTDKMRAAFDEYQEALARAELVFMSRIVATATVKPVAA